MRSWTDLPGPTSLPLIGNLLQLDLKQLHRVLDKWANEFGAIYLVKLGPRPMIVISDPEIIQGILRQRPNLYRRLGTIEPVFTEMGITGVFSAEGENWKRQRRLTAHALDNNHLRQFFPTLQKVTARLRKRWLAAAEKDEAVDVQQDLMRYTVDITTNLAFGHDVNTLEKEGDIIQQHLEKIFPAINRRIYASFPLWRYLKFSEDRALDKALAAIRETIDKLVAEGRERLAAHPELAAHPTNLLEAMLGARDEGNAAFTDQEIHGNVLTMLLAGEDTTANTMAWMAHFMIEYPEVQARLHRESKEVVGEAGILSDLAASERLEYLDAVTQESMRLKPVAPLIGFEPLQDTQIGDLAIPKNTALMLNTLHGCLQDDHFGAAKDFRPERWLKSEAPASGGCPHNARAFVPFGSGPRVCPGRHLAMVEIKTAISMLTAGFEVLKTDRQEAVRELFSFTMMPQNLFVSFRRRV